MVTKKEAKLARDKFVLDDWKDVEGNVTISKEQAIKSTNETWVVEKGIAAGLGISPENYDSIQKASRVFTVKEQANQFNKLQPLFYDKNNLWWLWNTIKFKWEMSDEVDILNMIQQATDKDVISPRSRLEILNSLKQEGRMNIPKNVKKTWVQFQDILVDVETGTEIGASPEFFITNPIPYKLHEERYIETPVMDRIFEEWVGKDNVKLLYEIMAYCLLPNYPIHRLFCLIGGGMNGKSCFLRLLTKFVGIHNITSTELDTLIHSRFEVAKLHKKLVCIMGETNFSEISKTSILKKLTGQDPIGFEYKNKNPFDDLNYAKIIIATNNLPTTTDKTIGFYRRWTIIDFPNQFSEEKEILNDIPEEEFEILGVKCLFLLKDLLDKRKFHNEGSIEDRIKKYESKSDFVQTFVDKFVVEDLDGHITKAEFYRKFVDWSVENRHRKLSETSFSLKLKDKGFEGERKYLQWMHDGKGGQARVWLGVKWK